MILVDNVQLRIDVAEWMRQTGKFDEIKTTGREWIQATCPFHNDYHPSFAVNEETGAYVCKACGASGGFGKLVAHVEGHDTIFDAEQSLIVRYGRFVPETNEELSLDFGDRGEETFVVSMPVGREPIYLRDCRGINRKTAARFEVCESVIDKAVMIPWSDDKGRCVTVKYRSTADKRFWYDPPIAPGRLKRLLFGFDLVEDADLIVVCEGEIDTMSVVQAGYAAVALGGANLSEAQASLLRNARASEIVVFTDNDEAGRKVRSRIVDALIGHKRVSAVDWSWYPFSKDANDVLRRNGENGVRDIVENRIPVPLPLRLV